MANHLSVQIQQSILSLAGRKWPVRRIVQYTRGLDLSTTPNGTGGIGGVLARTELDAGNGNQHQHAYLHADGGGNVTCLMDGAGRVAAKYVYDPFGGLVAWSGPLSERNEIRFSSKHFNSKSGLYYYGYRFYDPGLQRWLNRDPIGEAGGFKLQQFVRNMPYSYVDPFGLKIAYSGPEGEAAKNEIECWKSGLPKNSPLLKLINELENDSDTLTIRTLDKATVWDPTSPTKKMPATIPQTKLLPTVNSLMSINPVAYWLNNDRSNKDNYYTYREALAHELLHAHDQIVTGNRRGHRGDFLAEEKVLRKDAKCDCPTK